MTYRYKRFKAIFITNFLTISGAPPTYIWSMWYVIRSKVTLRYGFVSMGMITWEDALERGHRWASREEAEQCVRWNGYTWDEVDVTCVYTY